MKNKLFNAWFYGAAVTLTLVQIPFLYLFFLPQLLFCSRRVIYRRLRKYISLYGSVIVRWLTLAWVRVEFKDFEPELNSGGCLFVCNHRSASDPFLMSCLPRSFEIIQVVNIWPMRLPVMGYYARLAGYLSVREMSFDDFRRRALDLLAGGVSIAAFPEGTRSAGRQMGHFHGGIFRLALETGCPIVPVCVMGNERIPDRGFVMHPGRIQVHKLKALRREEYEGKSAFVLKNMVRERLAAHMREVEGDNGGQ